MEANSVRFHVMFINCNIWFLGKFKFSLTSSLSPKSESLPWLKDESALYFLVLLAVFLYAMSSMMLQSSITAVSWQGSERSRRLNREGLRIGSLLKFLPPRVSRSDGLDSLGSELRIGVRAPKLALGIYIPYPLQWGSPTFHAGEAFAIIAASFVSLFETLNFRDRLHLYERMNTSHTISLIERLRLRNLHGRLALHLP